jgi:hypothetical protein
MDTPWNNTGYRSRYPLRHIGYPIAAHAASSWPWFESYDSGLGDTVYIVSLTQSLTHSQTHSLSAKRLVWIWATCTMYDSLSHVSVHVAPRASHGIRHIMSGARTLQLLPCKTTQQHYIDVHRQLSSIESPQPQLGARPPLGVPPRHRGTRRQRTSTLRIGPINVP